jgi:lactate 2-monooxygenase
MANYGDYQNEIYFGGLSGRLPRFPIHADELEAKAHQSLPKNIVSYLAGGCGDERTQNANISAFDRWV